MLRLISSSCGSNTLRKCHYIRCKVWWCASGSTVLKPQPEQCVEGSTRPHTKHIAWTLAIVAMVPSQLIPWPFALSHGWGSRLKVDIAEGVAHTPQGKSRAKCLEVPQTTDGYHRVILNPLALVWLVTVDCENCPTFTCLSVYSTGLSLARYYPRGWNLSAANKFWEEFIVADRELRKSFVYVA